MTTDPRIIEDLRQEYERLLKTDVQAALPLVRQAAHWGDLPSQILAADLCKDDPELSRQYTRLAALNGHAPSMVRLADWLESQNDAAAAFYFLKKAADAGYEPAFDKLSLCYLQGRGTKKDLQQARCWNEKADQSDPTVIRHRRLIQLHTK